MRDAFPSFGILGLLKGLVNRVRKPRDMSEYNKLSLTAPEDQKVYIPKGRDPSMIIDNPFKNQDFNYGITNNPLTQQLQTQNYFPKSDINPAFQNMVTQVGWNTPQRGMVESLKDLGFSATDAYKKLSAQNKSKGLVFKDYPDPLQPQEFYDKWYGGSFDSLPENKRKQVPQEVDTQIQNIYKGYI